MATRFITKAQFIQWCQAKAALHPATIIGYAQREEQCPLAQAYRDLRHIPAAQPVEIGSYLWSVDGSEEILPRWACDFVDAIDTTHTGTASQVSAQEALEELTAITH